MNDHIATTTPPAARSQFPGVELRTWHLGLIALVSAALLLFAGLFASTGFFIVDEVAYVIATDALRLHGSLLIERGYEIGRSLDLTMTNILKLGPDGVVSQYPAGSAFAWAIPVNLFGITGIILFNAACLGAALFATRALALQLLGCERRAMIAVALLMGGAYVLEYAFTIWPHAASLATIAWGMKFFIDALPRQEGALRPALVSGLVIGAGLMFRVDNILILPAILAISLVWAARPVTIVLGGALGLLPWFAVLSVTNAVKFGTFNPLSYGATGSGGGVDLWTYAGLAAALGAAMLLLVALRVWTATGREIKAAHVLVVAAVAVVLIATLPAGREIARRIAFGILYLLIDARMIPYPAHMAETLPGGAVLYANLAKKAVAQSMPWVGVLLLLAAPWARKTIGARAISICGLVVLLWTLPFLLRQWHGGMGFSMRYLIPTLPFVAILGAAALAGLLDRMGRGAGRALATGWFFGVGAAILWSVNGPDGPFGMGQILSLWTFLGCSLSVAAVALRPTAATALIAVWLTGTGLGVALSNAVVDTWLSQTVRERLSTLSDPRARFEGRVVLYGHALRTAYADPDQIVAMRFEADSGPDPDLVAAALESDYRVLMAPSSAEMFLSAHPGYRAGTPVTGPLETVEIVRAPR